MLCRAQQILADLVAREGVLRYRQVRFPYEDGMPAVHDGDIALAAPYPAFAGLPDDAPRGRPDIALRGEHAHRRLLHAIGCGPHRRPHAMPRPGRWHVLSGNPRKRGNGGIPRHGGTGGCRRRPPTDEPTATAAPSTVHPPPTCDQRKPTRSGRRPGENAPGPGRPIANTPRTPPKSARPHAGPTAAPSPRGTAAVLRAPTPASLSHPAPTCHLFSAFRPESSCRAGACPYAGQRHG